MRTNRALLALAGVALSAPFARAQVSVSTLIANTNTLSNTQQTSTSGGPVAAPGPESSGSSDFPVWLIALLATIGFIIIVALVYKIAQSRRRHHHHRYEQHEANDYDQGRGKNPVLRPHAQSAPNVGGGPYAGQFRGNGSFERV